MNRVLSILVFSFIIAGCATPAQKTQAAFALQPGDLLFQDLDAGPLCDAIETVTQGVDGAKFSHVGMVSRGDATGVTVIEAVGAGVKETPIAEFLKRSASPDGTSRVLVGRIDGSARELIPSAIDVSRSFLGRPYDTVFTMDDSAFYCSELIYESFRVVNRGEPIFELFPMTFKDPQTNATFPAWTSYYADLTAPIPEGEPGLNPGGMSRAPFVHIVHAYGVPAGWSGSVAP